MTALSQPVESILSHLEGVHRNGSGATARCPSHDDGRASLSISEGDDGRALVNCFAGCKTEDVIAKLGITAADLFPPRERRDGFRVVGEYRYCDEAGGLRYVVERRDPKDFRQRRPDGRGAWLWNLQGVTPLPYRLPELIAADAAQPVLIVEGERDVETLHALGFIASTNSGGAGKWRPELSQHFTGRRVVIIPDNDEPGRKHAAQVAAALRGIASSVAILNLEGLPEKGDASTWLSQGGTADALRMLIATVPVVDIDSTDTPTTPAGVVDAGELRAAIDTLYTTGLRRGESTGLRTLDEFFTVRRGDLNLITGVPAHGKSGFLDQILVNLARSCEWRTAIFSAENYPVARHAAGLLEKILRKPFNAGPTPRMTPADVAKAGALLDACFRFIDPADDRRTVEGILEIMEGLAGRERIDICVLDPWAELDHTRPAGMTETEHVSRCLSRVRLFARKHELAFFIVAHPAKMLKGQDGKYPVPTPYDIAGSAHWRNKADNCISIWRDTTNGDRPEVEIHIQKIRFREVGRIGMVTVRFDRVTGRYTDAPATTDEPTRKTRDRWEDRD